MQFKSLNSPLTTSQDAIVQDISNDIIAAQAKTETLRNIINAFPAAGGTPAQVTAIHNAIMNTITAIDQITSDALRLSCPLEDEDAFDSYSLCFAVVVNLERGLTDLTKKSSSIRSIGLQSEIKHGLKDYEESTMLWGDSLIRRAPALTSAMATGVQIELRASFATAIAAYT